jgi:hypothetical protein
MRWERKDRKTEAAHGSGMRWGGTDRKLNLSFGQANARARGSRVTVSKRFISLSDPRPRIVLEPALHEIRHGIVRVANGVRTGRCAVIHLPAHMSSTRRHSSQFFRLVGAFVEARLEGAG